MRLILIVYVSAASPGFHGGPLAAMVQRAQVRNAALQVTGCLLHYDGSFMQVLEGPAERVQQVYGCIRADQRHHQLVQLHQGDLPQRMFAGWNMQLAEPGDAVWNALYRMTQPRVDAACLPALRPLLGGFLISGDRHRAFEA